MVNHRRTSAHTEAAATVVLNTSVAEGIITIDISFTRLTDSRCERHAERGTRQSKPLPAGGDDAGRLAIDQCAIRRSREWIQICASDITRTAVFGTQVKPVTVGKALIAKAIAVVIEGVAALLDRLRADAGPAFGAITETRASATTEFIFVRTRLADRKPSSMAPLQSLSIPSQASAVGSGALQPDQPIPGWQVSSPKQRPSKPSAVLTQALVSPAWSSEQSQNAISGIHWGTSKDCPEASSV